MSNSVVVIYKFLTLTNEVSYYVSYQTDAEKIADMSFEEFRNVTKKNRLSWGFESARRIANKFQKVHVPEFTYLEYDGYLNSFSLNGYPDKEFVLMRNPYYTIDGEEKDVEDKDESVSTVNSSKIMEELESIRRELESSNEEKERLEKKRQEYQEEIEKLKTVLNSINRMSFFNLLCRRIRYSPNKY